MTDVILSQMSYMESFIEDLLNVHMLTHGVFKLDLAVFDPQESIDFVYEIFRL